MSTDYDSTTYVGYMVKTSLALRAIDKTLAPFLEEHCFRAFEVKSYDELDNMLETQGLSESSLLRGYILPHDKYVHTFDTHTGKKLSTKRQRRSGVTVWTWGGQYTTSRFVAYHWLLQQPIIKQGGLETSEAMRNFRRLNPIEDKDYMPFACDSPTEVVWDKAPCAAGLIKAFYPGNYDLIMEPKTLDDDPDASYICLGTLRHVSNTDMRNTYSRVPVQKILPLIHPMNNLKAWVKTSLQLDLGELSFINNNQVY